MTSLSTPPVSHYRTGGIGGVESEAGLARPLNSTPARAKQAEPREPEGQSRSTSGGGMVSGESPLRAATSGLHETPPPVQLELT